MSKSWHIYILTDPRDGLVRYVGKTIRPKGRLHSHICEAIRGKEENHRTHWIRSVIESGYFPAMSVLESGTGDWQEAERRWIKTLREAGADLVNSTDGGDGIHNPSAETRAKMSANLKRRWTSPEARTQLLASLRTSEYRTGRSIAAKTQWRSQEHRKKISKGMLNAWEHPGFRAKVLSGNKAKWERPEYREKLMASIKVAKSTPEHRARMSAMTAARWRLPGYREKIQATWARKKKKKEEPVA